MEPIIGKLDDMGFHSLEVWGGATFDVAHRFLNEDPWERLKTFKRLATEDAIANASSGAEPCRVPELSR